MMILQYSCGKEIVGRPLIVQWWKHHYIKIHSGLKVCLAKCVNKSMLLWCNSIQYP